MIHACCSVMMLHTRMKQQQSGTEIAASKCWMCGQEASQTSILSGTAGCPHKKQVDKLKITNCDQLGALIQKEWISISQDLVQSLKTIVEFLKKKGRRCKCEVCEYLMCFSIKGSETCDILTNVPQ